MPWTSGQQIGRKLRALTLSIAERASQRDAAWK
jgi:hypothetical protein